MKADLQRNKAFPTGAMKYMRMKIKSQRKLHGDSYY